MTDEEKIKAMMEEEHKIMEGYVDTAKTFTQLSIGALVLSVTFLEKILGLSGKISVPYLLVLAWLFWLLAALSGAFYQYRAVKWLEECAIKNNIIKKIKDGKDLLKIDPYLVYGALLVCFFLGTIFFAVFGSIKVL